MLCPGCGAATSGTTTFDVARDGADARRAHELAPDLVAGAERAHADARAATADDARHDHEARAMALLDAAIVEAQRIKLDRKLGARDAETERLVRERAEHEGARVAAVHESARLEAARHARAEAVRVFGLAERDEATRVPKAERERLHAEAAAFLLQRAELVLAAAQALGLAADGRTASEAALAKARAAPGSATERLRLAQSAIESAERALGRARAAQPGPSPEEVRSLLAGAAERGIDAELLERGLALRLLDVFRAGSGELAPNGRRQLADLAALARAHPHGPLRVEAHAEGTSRAASRLADARARHVRSALGEAGDRVQVEPHAPAADASGAQVTAVFSAYATVPES